MDREGVVAELVGELHEVALHVQVAGTLLGGLVGLLVEHVAHGAAQFLADVELGHGELLRQQHEDGGVGAVGLRFPHEAAPHGVEHGRSVGILPLDAVAQRFQRLAAHEGEGGDEMGVGAAAAGLAADQADDLQRRLRHGGERVADHAGGLALVAGPHLVRHGGAELQQRGTLGRPIHAQGHQVLLIRRQPARVAPARRGAPTRAGRAAAPRRRRRRSARARPAATRRRS